MSEHFERQINRKDLWKTNLFLKIVILYLYN